MQRDGQTILRKQTGEAHNKASGWLCGIMVAGPREEEKGSVSKAREDNENLNLNIDKTAIRTRPSQQIMLVYALLHFY